MVMMMMMKNIMVCTTGVNVRDIQSLFTTDVNVK